MHSLRNVRLRSAGYNDFSASLKDRFSTHGSAFGSIDNERHVLSLALVYALAAVGSLTTTASAEQKHNCVRLLRPCDRSP
jgi:hypothetical protein